MVGGGVPDLRERRVTAVVAGDAGIVGDATVTGSGQLEPEPARPFDPQLGRGVVAAAGDIEHSRRVEPIGGQLGVDPARLVEQRGPHLVRRPRDRVVQPGVLAIGLRQVGGGQQLIGAGEAGDDLLHLAGVVAQVDAGEPAHHLVLCGQRRGDRQ